MKIFKTSGELLEWRRSINLSCLLGFVPTMGALHDGHLSLIKKCVDECDVSCVSIFINPLQFDGNEDLDSYPADVENDLKKISALEVDSVFVPGVSDIYNDGDSFILSEAVLSRFLEGKSRPKFFNGVLTVVSKLFNIVRPSKAYFGMKDAQQLILIKKMVQDMKYPINIVACETIRENNGLAMSSRNEYLTAKQYDAAKIIYQSLLQAKQLIGDGICNSKIIKKHIRDMILSVPGFRVDYISVANINTLKEINYIKCGDGILISLAVFLANVRLIDNIYMVE